MMGAVYRYNFGGDPPLRFFGIEVLSDANSLQAKEYADYDDIVCFALRLTEFGRESSNSCLR